MAYASTTLSELDSRLLKLVGGEGNFWTSFEREMALNEALSVWQVLVGEFSTQATWAAASAADSLEESYDPSSGAMTWAIGTATAPLPLSIWRIGTVGTYTTQGLATYPKVTQVSAPELDYSSPGWRALAATTLESWAPYGLNKVVFPVHTSVTLAVDYFRGDKPLPLATSYIQLGDEEVQAILSYAVWQLNIKCGTSEAFELTKPLGEMLVLAAQLRNQKLRGTQLYKDFLGADKGESEPSRDAAPQKGAR